MEQPPPIRFELRRGAITPLPLAIAVRLFGVSFGVLSATLHCGVLLVVIAAAATAALIRLFGGA